jgi:hypothetical protein
MTPKEARELITKNRVDKGIDLNSLKSQEADKAVAEIDAVLRKELKNETNYSITLRHKNFSISKIKGKGSREIKRYAWNAVIKSFEFQGYKVKNIKDNSVEIMFK